MHCNTCGSDIAARIRGWWDKDQNKYQEVCDICANVPAVWLPDVYLGGCGGREQIDENLCNRDTHQPIPFSSKREKAAIMRMLQVREAGDKKHGMRLDDTKIKNRELF